MTTAKTILRRLFRVYAHIYHSHFDQISALGIEGESLQSSIQHLHDDSIVYRADAGLAHLNTNYRHFLLFVDEVRSPVPSHICPRPHDQSIEVIMPGLADIQFSLLSDNKDLLPLEELNKRILAETGK